MDLRTLAWFALLPVMGPEYLQDKLREWANVVAGEADFGHGEFPRSPTGRFKENVEPLRRYLEYLSM